MKQELKNYFAQFIMVEMNKLYYEIYRSWSYSTEDDYFSKVYLGSSPKVFEPIFKNITFCNSIINDDSDYNHPDFVQALGVSYDYNLASRINEAKKYLKKNIQSSFILKFEEDIDDSFFENMLDNYLPIALNSFTRETNYGQKLISQDFLKEGLLYCAKNNLFSNPKTSKDFFDECKSTHVGKSNRFTSQSFSSQMELRLDNEQIECKFEDIIKLIFKNKVRFLDSKTEKAFYYIGSDIEFVKSFYNELSTEEKEVAVFNSRFIDLVEKNICIEPNIISSAKKHLNLERFSKKDAIFSSKYYPEIFNDKVKNMMIAKERDELCELGIFQIASIFSGVTKKMARYLRSESSEKRAVKIFASIKDRIFLQENVLEVLTQFADTKHDRLLSEIIKKCPEQYLYLFISNKLVRGAGTWSNNTYGRRNN